jgi:hypothetical protein
VLAWAAFALLALAAEVVGRFFVHRIDVGRHVASPVTSQAGYYPLLVAGIKVGIALLAARLAWRVVRARAVERAGRRLLGVVPGCRGPTTPRVRLVVSVRLWFATFAVTSGIYLVQVDLEQAGAPGRWPLLAPWLHTSALPFFAVLAVLVALAWHAVAGFLSEYEEYAHATLALGLRAAARRSLCVVRRLTAVAPPRSLLVPAASGSRPPPLPV